MRVKARLPILASAAAVVVAAGLDRGLLIINDQNIPKFLVVRNKQPPLLYTFPFTCAWYQRETGVYPIR